MYDLLLFDIRMPETNGFNVYRKIKDIEEAEKRVKNGKPRVCFITDMNFAVNLRKHFQL